MKPIALDYFGNPCKPVDVPSVRIVECPACKGTGYVEHRGEVTQRCGQCYGRGRLASENGEV